MIARILLAAIAAGLIAGAAISVVQAFKVTPLIYAAETYELAGAAPPSEPAGASHQHGHDGEAAPGHSHDHGGEAWAPADGFERVAFTALSNLLVGVGFALLLTGGMTIRGQVGGWRQGMVWGGAGFLAFALLPGLGLPPELPGMAAADLAQRQLWWVLTAISSVAGIALVAYAPGLMLRVLGIAIIAIPHIAGAPHPAPSDGLVPAELAAQFVSASLATAGLFWLMLGALTGHFVGRGFARE